jgi:hypothetical protein
MRTRRALALALLASGCARGPSPERCKIEIERVARFDARPGDVRAAYLVAGEAGSPGKAWLAAKRAEGDYVSGDALPVGPGPFRAEVKLRLTGRPAEYVAVLEVAGGRCWDRKKAPK